MRNLMILLLFIFSTMFIGYRASAKSGVLASAGGVDIVLTPDEAPLLDGAAIGGIISLRSADGTSLTVAENLVATNLHQISIPAIFDRRVPTPRVVAFDAPGVPPNWRPADSHILIRNRADELGMPTINFLQETNDESDPVGAATALAFDTGVGILGPFAGVGDMSMMSHDDAIFFEDASNNIDFARFVGIPGTSSHVTLSVVGEGIESCIEGTTGACFDFDITWSIPEPPTSSMLLITSVTALFLHRRRRGWEVALS